MRSSPYPRVIVPPMVRTYIGARQTDLNDVDPAQVTALFGSSGFHNTGSFGALRGEETLLKCVFIERVAQPFPWEEIAAAPLWEGQETRISDRTKLPTHLSRPR